MKFRSIVAAGLFLTASYSLALAGNVLSVGVGSAPNDNTGDTLRTAFGKINTAVNGLASCFNGTSAPSFLMSFQCWMDTSTTPVTLRYYDGTQWVAAGTLDQTAHVFAPQGGMTVGGDLTGTLPNPTLLTSVNANVGTFGTSTTIPIVTVNNKGQVTAVTTAASTAAAGTLTGATLAAGVVNSSLTSVGIIGTGQWNATPIAVTEGGTGLTTLTAHGLLVGEGASNVAVTSPGTAGQVLISNGAGADATFQTLAQGIIPPQGRLTLVSATPMMSTTAAGQAIVYYTPDRGTYIPIPVSAGGQFSATAFAELSQATTDTTKSPAAVAASSCYDMFVWSDSGTIRLSRGPAWTTCAGAGVRAAGGGLMRPAPPNNGFPVNVSDITNGPLAGLGTWVGTIASNGASTIDWIYGASATGGTAGTFGVWNAYNQAQVYSITQDSTAGYTYTTQTYRQANASAGMQCSFVSGSVGRTAFDAQFLNLSTDANTSTPVYAGIGFNSTTSPSGVVGYFSTNSIVSSLLKSEFASPFLGFDTFVALEKGNTGITFDGQGANGVGGLICSGMM